MKWAEALKDVVVMESAGPDVDIVGVEYDSRRVGPGAAFVAMRGGTTAIATSMRRLRRVRLRS
jgi:UDP-N-acetylmuramoyl-L-alanyl-D-glutamate--2,6-diaminopimelate ligase